MASTTDERELWIDYLVHLNDRGLQKSRSSGATNWLLATAVAAIAYQGVPQLPRLFASHDAIKSSIAIFTLEANAAILLWVFGWFIGAMCMDQPSEPRIMPARSRRSELVFVWSLSLVSVALAALNLLVFATVNGPRLLRWTALAFGILWPLELLELLIERHRAKRKEKEQGIPKFAPKVNVPRLLPLTLTLGIIPCVALAAYLYFLAQTVLGWLVPLSAGTQVLTVVLVLLVLFKRSIKSSTDSFYQRLEQDIVVDSLDPAQIRRRFVDNILGGSLSEWINGIEGEIKEFETGFGRFVESVEVRLKKIESIDSDHHFERIGQARQLEKELENELEKTNSKIQTLQERLTACGSTCEANALLTTAISSLLDQTKAFDNKRKTADELLRRITAFSGKESALQGTPA